VDTHLINGHHSVVSADFDSLIAKLIITASDWQGAVSKAQRALADTQITGVKTNLDILRGIVAHHDFLEGHCDTQWLEKKQEELYSEGQKISAATSSKLVSELSSSSTGASLTATNTLFRKGDAWSITLTPKGENNESRPKRHLELTRVLRNEFPTSLSADILFTSPSNSANARPETTPYTITLTSTSASASAATSTHRRGNPSDPSHVSIPFPGKLVEVLVDEGDVVKEGDVICVVQQMKMELEVRTRRSGRVTWITEAEDGEEVAEGMLAAVVEGEREARL
jgi:acetyl/propionyl-CoA carboxylase alpha subunit